MPTHAPVLVEEVLAALRPRDAGVFPVAPFGRGRPTRSLLSALGWRGRALADHREPDPVAAGTRMAIADSRLTMIHARFGALADIVVEHDLRGALDGIVLDLGVSSPQLDTPERGFSLRAEGPLDMRMDPRHGISAAAWLKHADRDEIASVLRRFGEEPQARRIARAIVHTRRERPLLTTADLAAVVVAVKGAPRPGAIHPATRTFQAVRIHVNRELDELAQALAALADCLAPGGRAAVISFHSLEDRMVKRALRRAQFGEVPRGLPVRGVAHRPCLTAVGRARRADAAEIARNPRARSAVLRVAERPA